MRWMVKSLTTLVISLALIAVYGSDARDRFESALQKHGGDAYKQLLQRGFKVEYDITREYGGKSEAKRVEYRRANFLRTENTIGSQTEIVAFDGSKGWHRRDYLVGSLAQEEIGVRQDTQYMNFWSAPRWTQFATVAGGAPARMADGRTGYRITFEFPVPERHQRLPKRPENKFYCYLDDENRIIGIEYDQVDYETDEITRIVRSYQSFREFETPQGKLLVPNEIRIYAGGTHVSTMFVRALDAQTEIAESLFERPQSEMPPIVREKLPTKVPFRLKGFSMLVQIHINDKGPYWVIFDTGAYTSWLDDSIVKETGLEKVPNSEHVSVLVYGAFPSYNARAKSIRIGDAEIRDVEVSVGPVRLTPLGGDRMDGKPIIGLLGRETLAAFQTTLNFAERTVTFEPPDADLPDGMVIPYETYGNHILVTMGIGDKQQIRMIVDTGAAANLLPPSYQPLKEDGVWMNMDQWYKRMGEMFEADDYGFITETMRVYRIHKMTLGPLRFENQFAFQQFAESARADSIIGMKTKHGLLGIPAMRHYKVTFNYFREVMVWQPNTVEERMADNAGYGIWWRRQGKDIIVDWVMPLSDADLAGVKKGDKIVLVDGQSPASWTEKQLVDRISYTKPGRPLKLTVERGGKRLEFNLTALTYEL